MNQAKSASSWPLASLAIVSLVLGLSMFARAADEPTTLTAPVTPAVPVSGAIVSGKVVDANAQGIAGAKVILVKAADVPKKGKHKDKDTSDVPPTTKPADDAATRKHQGPFANLPAVATATTDANGAFTFDSKVADGDYVVLGFAKGQGRDQQDISVVNGVNPAAVTLTLHQGKAGGNKTKTQ